MPLKRGLGVALEKWDAGFDVGFEDRSEGDRSWRVEPRPLGEMPGRTVLQVSTVQPTSDLVEQLARELARAHGEDPDAQPHPLRFPCWRYYRARAKALLAITPTEHRALATLLG